MAYTKTAWVNDAPPDIDADNLNKMEQGIYDAQFPEGGSAGQLLARTETGLGWIDPPNSAVWGGITGTLSNQSDLNNALGAKANASTLATVESSSTASRAYSVGSYLVYNGILYRVTAAISSGQTLTPGTNITATNAGAELASLNNDLSNIYRFVEVLPWGTYGTVGQTATLNRDITKAKMAMFEVGWNSPPNKSGLNCSLIPQMMLAVGSTITIPYVVGGVFSYVIVNIASATSITIADSNNTNLGLRAIVGVF